jgi:hypothetical protein
MEQPIGLVEPGLETGQTHKHTQALAGVTYPRGSVGTLGLMLVWRRWLVDTTPR